MNAKNNLPDFLKEQLKTIDKLQQRNNMLSSDFEIEKNCKNQAYFFILESGYFDEYVEYTKANPVQPVQAR
jgi:hypothetical protein